MENNGAVVGALIFIVMVLGANFLTYGIVRGWTRAGNKNFFETIGQSFKAAQNKENEMDELRRKMDELEKGKKE